MHRTFLLIAITLLTASIVRAENLSIHLPTSTTKPTAATAVSAAMKLNATGTIDGRGIYFDKLLPITPYDISITLEDGTILQGVDMGWYNQEAVNPKTDPMVDADKTEIYGLVTPDKDFFNKIDIIQLAGDHNRATALVKQIRDKGFHSDKGGEVISRFELWYFRFEYGGWEKVQQGQKLLRRDRFASEAAFEKTIGPIRWTPELGGIKLEKGEKRTITLPASSPTTQPTARPAK